MTQPDSCHTWFSPLCDSVAISAYEWGRVERHIWEKFHPLTTSFWERQHDEWFGEYKEEQCKSNRCDQRNAGAILFVWEETTEWIFQSCKRSFSQFIIQVQRCSVRRGYGCTPHGSPSCCWVRVNLMAHRIPRAPHMNDLNLKSWHLCVCVCVCVCVYVCWLGSFIRRLRPQFWMRWEMLHRWDE